MTLEEAKLYLRVDMDDDDTLIQALITAAESYIAQQTGKTKILAGADENGQPIYEDIKESELWKLAVKLLLAHWYENRGVETSGRVTATKISHSVDALVKHIAMCGDYV